MRLGSHKIYLVIAIITGIIVRLYGLDIQSLWFDEIFSVSAAYNNFSTVINMWILGDTNPPLYQLFLYYWIKLFGNSEIVVRLPSAIAGIATIFSTYFLTKRIFDKYIAASTTILISLSSAAIMYSQEARPYSFLLLFSAITTLLLLNILKNKDQPEINNQELRVYTAIAILTAFIHYLGSILIFVQLAYLFLNSLIYKAHRKKVLIVTLIIGCIFLPWVLIHSYYISKTVIPEIVKGNNLDIVGFFFNKYLFVLLLLPIITNFRILKIDIKDKIRNLKFNEPIVSLVVITGIIFLMVCVLIALSKAGHARYFIVILPHVYLLISCLLFSNPLFSKDKGVIYVFIFCLISFVLFLQGFYKPYKQQWREASKVVMEKYGQNSIIFVDRYPQFYTYYFNRFRKTYSDITIEYLSEASQLKDIGKKYKQIFIFTMFYRIPAEKIDRISKRESLICEQKSYDAGIYVCECVAKNQAGIRRK